MKARPIGVGQPVGLLAIVLMVVWLVTAGFHGLTGDSATERAVQLATGLPFVGAAVAGVSSFVDGTDRRARWWAVLAGVLVMVSMVAHLVAHRLWDCGVW